MDKKHLVVLFAFLFLLPIVSAATVSESNIDRGIVLNPASSSTSSTITIQGLSFNQTYQDFAYNQTQAANKSIYELYNSVWRSTFNQTYADFAYNQSGGGSGTPGGANTQIQFNDGGVFGGNETFVFNKTNGRFGIGTSNFTATLLDSTTPNVQIVNTGAGAALSITRYSNNALTPRLILGKSRGSTPDNFTILQNNDQLGRIAFTGSDGTDVDTPGAYIDAIVTGTPNASGMPTSMRFQTNPGGAFPVERLRLSPTGNLGLGTATPEVITEIATTANDFIKLNRTAVNPWYIGNLGGGLAFDTASINTSAAKFIIESGGDVGIGTTNPTQKLHVIGTFLSDPANNPVGYQGQIDFGGGSGYRIISDSVDFRIDYFLASYERGLVIQRSTGNIGIGTATPKKKLDVNGGAQVKGGNSSINATIGGKITQHFTSRNNTGTAETEIYSFVLPANLLVNNGASITGINQGTFNTSATATRQVRAYLNGTQIFDSGALTTATTVGWKLDYTIMATNTTNVRTSFHFTNGATTIANYTTVNVNLLAASTLNITGTAAGVDAGSDQISDHMGWIRYEAEA